MIDETINTILSLIESMKNFISLDIEDIKSAKHENLLDRNGKKEEVIKSIIQLKSKLNEQLTQLVKNGVDVNIYRKKIDTIEKELKELYKVNRQLATIVLPIQQMYKDIVEEISDQNGGNLLNVKA